MSSTKPSRAKSSPIRIRSDTGFSYRGPRTIRTGLADGGFIRSEHLPVTPRRVARGDDENAASLPAGGVNLEDIERTLVVKALSDVDRTQPVFAVQTLEEVLASSIAPRRFNLALLSVFAGTALVLGLIWLL